MNEEIRERFGKYFDAIEDVDAWVKEQRGGNQMSEDTPVKHEPNHDLMIECLADSQHKIWSHWMQYLFSVSPTNADGSVTIPAAKAERWHRQIKTNYADLSEQERRSDIHMAEWAMEAIEPTISGQRNEIRFWQQRVSDLLKEIEGLRTLLADETAVSNALTAQLNSVPEQAIALYWEATSIDFDSLDPVDHIKVMNADVAVEEWIAKIKYSPSPTDKMSYS